jgi:hypothetical protein
MKNLFLVSVLALCASVFGSESPQNPVVIGKWGFVQQYLAYGSGAVIDPDPGMQSLLLVCYQNGVSLSLWNTTNFKKWNSTLGSEVDYGIGWSGKIAPYTTLDVGATYFDEPKVFTLGRGDIVYGHATVTREMYGLSASLGVERYDTMPKSGFQGGSLYSAGLSKKWPLSDDMVTVSNSVALAYDDGGFGFKRGFLARGVVTVDWKATKRLTLTIPQVYWYAPFMHDARKSNAMVYGGVGYVF